MKVNRRSAGIVLFGLALALSVAAAPALAAEDLERFAISQARQVGIDPPQLRAYLSMGEASVDAASLEGDLHATYGERALSLAQVQPFEALDEGVAYVFLVDISRSISQAQFGRLRSALETWISDLGPTDRAAVLSFGEQSRLVVDFTADRRSLKDGLQTLGPTDDTTLLHQALADAIQLCQRRDEGLPGRRVIVVLTDGRDEGSGLTVEDVLGRLRDRQTPIYAIGYSNLPSSQRRQYLDVLHRFPSNSGGTFFEANQVEFAEAYAEIRQAIGNVWAADFVCEGCRVDGSLRRLQVNLARGESVLSAGTDLRLLPPAALGAPPATLGASGFQNLEVGREGPAAERGRTGAAGDSGEPPAEGGLTRFLSWPYLLLGFLVLLLLLWLILRSRDDGSSVAEDNDEIQRELEAAGAGAAGRGGGAAAAGARARLLPRVVRLIVLQGNQPHREFSLILREKAVVGSRSSCDLVLAGESDIASEAFELFQRDQRIFIRNLSKGTPIRVEGLLVREPRPLSSGNVIGTGGPILRVVFS